MIDLAKQVAAKLPANIQQEMHRWLCGLKIRSGNFTHYEPEYLRLARWVQRGDTVLDIGANLGIYSAKFSQLVGADGHVFAFEPIPRRFEILCSNSKLFPHRNVTLINAAASDKADYVKLEVPSFENGIKAFTRASINQDSGVSSDSISAFSLKVDSIGIPGPIGFVKIDVEGHELQVLNGMKNTLTKDGPTLVVEGEDPEVFAFLADLGYDRETLEDSPNSVYIHKPL